MTRRSYSVPVLLLAIGAVTLVGCTPEPQPSPSPSASMSSPSASPSPSPSPSSDADTAGDYSAECDDILSPQAVYDYNPNLGRDTAFSPAAGSTAARLADLGGVVCAWMNLTSGEHVVVVIGEPASADAAAIEADVASAGTATTAFSAPGYFSTAAGSGDALVRSGRGVILVSSVAFIAPEDAVDLVNAAVASYEG